VDAATEHRSSADPDSARIRVSDAMHGGVITCPRETSLDEVARLMSTRRVHCVVVTDEADDRDLWGIVSDLDLAAAASVRTLGDQTAGATAATPLLTVGPDETVQRAAQLMTEHGTTHLVVVDAGHRPVGVISTLDVASVLSAAAAPVSP
jgi:CBS domain-containing protein